MREGLADPLSLWGHTWRACKAILPQEWPRLAIIALALAACDRIDAVFFDSDAMGWERIPGILRGLPSLAGMAELSFGLTQIMVSCVALYLFSIVFLRLGREAAPSAPVPGFGRWLVLTLPLYGFWSLMGGSLMAMMKTKDIVGHYGFTAGAAAFVAAPVLFCLACYWGVRFCLVFPLALLSPQTAWRDSVILTRGHWRKIFNGLMSYTTWFFLLWVAMIGPFLLIRTSRIYAALARQFDGVDMTAMSDPQTMAAIQDKATAVAGQVDGTSIPLESLFAGFYASASLFACAIYFCVAYRFLAHAQGRKTTDLFIPEAVA